MAGKSPADGGAPAAAGAQAAGGALTPALAANVARAKTCMKRWKGEKIDITQETVDAYLFLDSQHGRVSRSMLEKYLQSKTISRTTGDVTSMTFYLVDKWRFDNKPDPAFAKFILSDTALAKYDIRDVDLSAVWVVDEAAPRSDLGMEVKRKTFEVRANVSRVIPTEPGDPAAADGSLPGFVDFRPVAEGASAAPGASSSQQPGGSSEERRRGYKEGGSAKRPLTIVNKYF